MCLNASVFRTLSPAGVCPNAKPTNNTISVSFMSSPLILYLEIFNSISVCCPMDRKGRMTAYFGNSRRPDCPRNGYRYSLSTRVSATDSAARERQAGGDDPLHLDLERRDSTGVNPLFRCAEFARYREDFGETVGDTVKAAARSAVRQGIQFTV